MVRLVPRLRSIQARYTMTATVLFLIVLAVVGASVDLAIRYKIQDDAFTDAERVASQWSAAVRNGSVPHQIPTSTRVNLIQLVDAHGKVVHSSLQARGRPMSKTRPPSDDRFRRLAEGHVILMAIRLSPAADAPVVYAGQAEPSVLRKHHLEYSIAGSALVLLALAGWMTWYVVGRTLRPVAAIRSRMSEITVSDLSLRVPVPPGEDEIRALAETANATLDRLEDAYEQLRRFTSDASHDLRSPISAVLAQVEVALMYPDDADWPRTATTVLTGIQRLQAIVTDLLTLARLDAGAPLTRTPTDLAQLVGAELDHRTYGMKIVKDLRPNVIIDCDRLRITRVLVNLLDNAERHATSRITVIVRADGSTATLEVVDDGAGIAAEQREMVFERFARLDAARDLDSGGTGLGLAIAREIAEAHEGTLTIEDSERGARFVLRLPRMRSPSRPLTPVAF